MKWYPDKAERVRDFIQHLKHTKGEWAGQNFQLLPWQWDQVILPLFATLRDDGIRQYRTCYVEIPKKNGKTELGAAVALYMLNADSEATPEVYSAAADRDQASLVYMVAAQMVRDNDVLTKYNAVRDSRKRITNKRNHGFYQVLSSEVRTKHGLNPSAVIFDELHAQPDDNLYRVLTAGTDYARRQQLVFIMSTAGVYDTNSIWWRIREKARQIRDGIVKDDAFLPVLYIADPEKDDPADEELWRRVNPSMGRIFSLEKIRADYETAKENPIDFSDFLRFRLNIPVKQIGRWMPMDRWDACAGHFDPAALRNRTCCGGLDLSTTQDLTAFVLVFPPASDDDRWIVLPKFYVPEDTILKRSRSDRVHYDVWAKNGYLTATPGEVVDYEFVKRDILAASEEYHLWEIGFDPWNATQIATDLLNNYGIRMVECRQGAKTLSEPAKDLLKKVLAGKVAHAGHPVLRWCADNLVMVKDSNENIRPAKDKATDRIDGIVATINAWSRAVFVEEQSRYDTEGITVIEAGEK